MKIAACIIAALALSLAVPLASVAAQEACKFADEFAALASDLGLRVTGACTGAPSILESDEPVSFGDHVVITLPAGSMVQHTDRGVFRLDSDGGLVSFLDSWGVRSLGPDGAADISWAELAAAQTVQQAEALPGPIPTVTGPVTTAPVRTLDPILATRCYTTVREETLPMIRYMGRGRGQVAADFIDQSTRACHEAARAHGSAGVECYIFALRETMKMLRQPLPRGSAGDLSRFQTSLYEGCISAGR